MEKNRNIIMDAKKYHKFVNKVTKRILKGFLSELQDGGLIADVLQNLEYEDVLEEIMIKDPTCIDLENIIKARIEMLIDYGYEYEQLFVNDLSTDRTEDAKKRETEKG